MSTCHPHGPAVTAAAQTAAFTSMKAITKELQAQKHLPAVMTLGITPGVDASIVKEKTGIVSMHVDPSSMACLSLLQRKAVALHEAGHWHQPPAIGPEHVVGSAALLAATGTAIAVRISEEIVTGVRHYKESRLNPPVKIKGGFWEKMRLRREALKVQPPQQHCHWVLRLPLVTIFGGAFAAFGLHVASLQRANERQADMYAVRTMGEGKSLAGALTALGQVKLDNRTALQNVPQSNIWRQMGGEFTLFGPLGVFVTHPAPKVRKKAILEEDRRLAQAFNRPAKYPRLAL